MNSLLENNLNNNNEYLKNNTILIRSNSNISDIEKLINLISEQYLNNKNEIEIKKVENEKFINKTIESYKKQFEQLLKN
jgi:phosphoenolpyruvate carboxylase